MKKWIATMMCTAAALANAADSAQVGNCIAYASASRREQAAHDAYALADNPRVAIATAKQKDDPKLVEAVGRIEARVSRLSNQKRPPVLPAQCAPGKARMDAVNAGADK